MMMILYAAFCLAWAGVIACAALRVDEWGHWPWLLSVCAAMLVTLLLLLIWLWRLFRWHPVVFEVLYLLASVIFFCCWEFHRPEPITWYELDVSCCSGVATTPTWHVSPWKKVHMRFSDDWSAGRFGYKLVANDEEFHRNYHPRVGHGPCVVSFYHDDCGTKPIRDAFTLDLPRETAPSLRMQMAAASSAIGVIVCRDEDARGAYARYVESNLEPRQWCEKEGFLWFSAGPGCVLELPVSNGQVTFFIVYCPGLGAHAPEGISPYSVLPFCLTRK